MRLAMRMDTSRSLQLSQRTPMSKKRHGFRLKHFAHVDYRSLDRQAFPSLRASVYQVKQQSLRLIENLGNAVETTTSIDWTNPSWGGTPVLNDGSNNVYSITLQPGEKRELKILLDVPSSTTYGGTTTTTLTTCIGSGDDTLCRSLDANFTAVGSHTSPVHIRTVPDMEHAFEFKMLLPQSGTLSWDLNQANIALPNWQWNVTSGGSLQNGILTASGPQIPSTPSILRSTFQPTHLLSGLRSMQMNSPL